MNREKNLVKNIIIYAIGNFGSKMISFLLLPFYTYYLSAADYGYFDLITTTVMLLTPIITFQIYDGVYRYLLDVKDSDECSKYISNAFFITIRNMLFFSIAYILFIQIRSFKFDYLILLQIDLGIITGLWSQIARGLRDNINYSISGILSTIVTLISNIIFIAIIHLGVGSLIVSNIFASIIVIIYVDCKLKIHKYIKLKFNSKRVKEQLIKFSIPLIPNVVSWWFMNVSDRYFLAYYLGIDANGIYAISNRFSTILVMLNSIFNLAWQESAILEYDSNDKNDFYSKMFNILMKYEFSLVILLLAFTKLIMKYMININFYLAWKYIPFLYIGTILSAFSSFYGTGYLSAKDTIGSFYTSVLGGIINIVLNFVLIPIIGIQGASISTMISFLVMWLVRLVQTKKYFRIYINSKCMISLSIITVFFTLFYFINNTVINVIMMILSLFIFYIYNKGLINKVTRVVMNKIVKEY